MLNRFGIFLVFFIAFCWSSEEIENSCPPLCPPHRGSVFCSSGSKTVSCISHPSVGSKAEYNCQEFYKLEGEQVLRCLTNGSWSSVSPKCVPECGKTNLIVPLIVNGRVSIPGAFPWHVAIYNYIDGDLEFWCGGALVSEYTVITAAHCTWSVTATNFTLAFGKFHRDFDYKESNVQKIKVRKFKMVETYQDVKGNYNGDLALMFLDKPVEFNNFTRPICLDWNQQFMDKQLVQGNSGVVLGWGLTENDTLSDLLRILKLPVVDDITCINQEHEDFKKFITFITFCAGFGNGTGVCNGDSGGGLAFIDPETDRWYLQGLVSVSPRRKGTSFCDPNYYTIFTKVSMFMKWIKNIKEIEEKMIKPEDGNCTAEEKPVKSVKVKIKGWEVEINKDFIAFIEKYFKVPDLEIDGKKYIFPHTNNILESAGLKKTVVQ